MEREDLNNIIEWVKKIDKKDCRNETQNQGFFMVFKDKYLKKRKKVKKYNVVIHGDDIDELKINFKKIGREIGVLEFEKFNASFLKSIML